MRYPDSTDNLHNSIFIPEHTHIYIYISERGGREGERERTVSEGGAVGRAGRWVWGGGKPLKVLRTIFKLLIRLGGTAEKIDLSVGWVQTADITTEAEVRERETELENLILKDSSIRSIWTYLTAGPCYTTNSRYHNRRSRRSRGERERERERERDWGGRERVGQIPELPGTGFANELR